MNNFNLKKFVMDFVNDVNNNVINENGGVNVINENDGVNVINEKDFVKKNINIIKNDLWEKGNKSKWYHGGMLLFADDARTDCLEVDRLGIWYDGTLVGYTPNTRDVISIEDNDDCVALIILIGETLTGETLIEYTNLTE